MYQLLIVRPFPIDYFIIVENEAVIRPFVPLLKCVVFFNMTL